MWDMVEEERQMGASLKSRLWEFIYPSSLEDLSILSLVKVLMGPSPLSIKSSPDPELSVSTTRLGLGWLTTKGSTFGLFGISNIVEDEESWPLGSFTMSTKIFHILFIVNIEKQSTEKVIEMILEVKQ